MSTGSIKGFKPLYSSFSATSDLAVVVAPFFKYCDSNSKKAFSPLSLLPRPASGTQLPLSGSVYVCTSRTMSTSPLSSFSESISEALEAVTFTTTPLAIQESRAWLQGALLAMCMYGIHLTLFTICSSTLIRQLKQSRKIFIENGCYRLKEFLVDSGTKLRILLITYTVSMLVCGTVMVASQCYVTQAAFVDHNIRVGQPAKWEEMKYTGPLGTAGHTTWVISTWLGELVTVGALLQSYTL